MLHYSQNIAEVHVWKKVWTTSEEEKYLVQLVCLVDILVVFKYNERICPRTDERIEYINSISVAETEGGANVECYSRCLVSRHVSAVQS